MSDTNQGFTVIILTHQKRLLAYCQRQTGNYSDACDMMQETFRKAYEAYKRDPSPFIEDPDTCRAYLVAIAKRIRLNNVRNALYNARKIKSFTHVHERIEYINVSNRYNQAETLVDLQDIIKHIDDIPDVYRSVLIPTLLGDDSHEVSASLGIPINTVKSRLSRARQILKSKVTGTQLQLK